MHRYSCAISDRDGTVILTGGLKSQRSVTRYTGYTVHNGKWKWTDLPNLLEGRMNHACGSYLGEDGHQVRCSMALFSFLMVVNDRIIW